MDDVQHLVKAAREETFLFVVDSRMRDTAVHPTPSEYEITFNSPFRNVFGLDLVDAAVARTEYIVDAATNGLDYVMNVPTSLTGTAGRAWNQGRWLTEAVDAGNARTPLRSLALDPGDYNLPQFVDQLNAKFAAAATTYGEPPITCAPLTTPSEISNRLVFSCQVPFTFVMSSSSLRHTLGFGDPVTSASAAEYRAVPGWTPSLTGGANDVFLSAVGAIAAADGRTTPATLGPLPAGDGVKFEPVYGARVLRQHFVAQATGPAAQVLAYVYVTSAQAPALAVRVARQSGDQTVATGTLAAAADDPNTAYVPAACTLTPASGQLVVQGQAYYVEFTAVGGGGNAQSCAAVYYNADNLPLSASRFATLDGSPVHEGENLCVDVVCGSYGHYVTSPGLVNLTGPRYVNIRCPTVESHAFRDRVNESVHIGLGMLKLSGYGVREQRFEYIHLPPRRFHPIGRLTKLLFRLERPDGTPYDSHGVDHTLLLAVRYYVMPSQDADAGAETDRMRRLNPAYTPDVRQLLVQHRWADEARALAARDAKRF